MPRRGICSEEFFDYNSGRKDYDKETVVGMKAKKNPKLKEHRLNQFRTRILNDRTGIHASDLDWCPLKTGYRKFHPDPPPVPEISLLNFASGIMAEHWIFPETIEPREKDGIIASPDYYDKEFGYGEFKSTTMKSSIFDPERSQPMWIFRLKTYCNVFEVLRWNLEVLFWTGNYADIKKDYREWTLYFTEEELKEHWVGALRRKAVLEEIFKAIKDGRCPPLDKIWLQSWQCRGCEFAPKICHYKNGLKKDTNFI